MMHNKNIYTGILLILLIIVLSGCITQERSNNGNNVEIEEVEPKENIDITNLKVVTRYDPDPGTWTERDGFYHNYDEVGCSYEQYVITGNIKNVGDRPIDRVSIYINYYDDKGNKLCDDDGFVSDLYIGESKNFVISTNSCYYDFFEHVENYKLSTSIKYH